MLTEYKSLADYQLVGPACYAPPAITPGVIAVMTWATASEALHKTKAVATIL